jgi:hypothetical protein
LLLAAEQIRRSSGSFGCAGLVVRFVPAGRAVELRVVHCLFRSSAKGPTLAKYHQRTDPIAINATVRYYTGNFRFWCARPLMADASLCPATTRTPSSIRAITLSAVQDCRNAMPFLRQAARTRSRAINISNG